MARLYKYADSSDESGYFLRGGSADGNYTMGATDLGKQLLDRLGFEPGIVNRKRGPRVGSDLQWAMYEVGLLETGDSDPSGAGVDGEIDVEKAEITDEMMAELEEFVLGDHSDRSEVRSLAEIFGIDVNDDSPTPIWEITESKGESVANAFRILLVQRLCTEDAPEWNITVRHTPEIPGSDGTTTFNADIEHPSEENEVYTHEMYYVADEYSDTPGVATMTKAPVDADRRIRIDRQRGCVLELMSHVPQLLNVYGGDPTQKMNFVILEGVLE
jgi:hypothetical protein